MRQIHYDQQNKRTEKTENGLLYYLRGVNSFLKLGGGGASSNAARRRTLFGKQAKSSESLVNLRGLGKWIFWAKTRLLAVPQAIWDQYGGVFCIIYTNFILFKAINDPIRWVPNNKKIFPPLALICNTFTTNLQHFSLQSLVPLICNPSIYFVTIHDYLQESFTYFS